MAESFNKKIPLHLKITNENLLSGKSSLNIDLCDSRIKDWCAKPQRDIELSGQKINDYVTISPNIKGEWRFNWRYNINFITEDNFQAHKTYKITVNTNDFLPNFIDLKDNHINFTILPFFLLLTHLTQ